MCDSRPGMVDGASVLSTLEAREQLISREISGLSPRLRPSEILSKVDTETLTNFRTRRVMWHWGDSGVTLPYSVHVSIADLAKFYILCCDIVCTFCSITWQRFGSYVVLLCEYFDSCRMLYTYRSISWPFQILCCHMVCCASIHHFAIFRILLPYDTEALILIWHLRCSSKRKILRQRRKRRKGLVKDYRRNRC